MDIKELKRKYRAQRNGAQRRGIEWKLTFEEWVNWWGDDIPNRGKTRFELQMQRYGDIGAYELGNIKKGIPKHNAATRSSVCQNRKSDKAKMEHEAYLNTLMWEPSAPDKTEKEDYLSEYEKEMKNNGNYSSQFFVKGT